MNRTRFPISAVCCLMLITLLLVSFGAVSAQLMEGMDDMAMDDMPKDDMMMDDMAMDDMMMMMAPPRICTDLPAHIAVYSNSIGISCQDVGTAGIGVMSVVDAGVISAIDIWSPVGVDAEVCFSIAGPITVLDSSTAPRMAMSPDVYSRDNLNCVHLSAAATVVLGTPSPDDMMMMDDMMMEDDMAMEDDMMMDEEMAMEDDMMMMEDDMMMERAPRICTDLPAHIAVYSNSMDINCRDVGAAGIGVMSIIDAGVISAIDVWSSVGVDAEVCFSIAGPITVLDAATAPRMAMTPDVYVRDNLNCVHLTGAATVVLGESS
ncbi:MAG: hypothetical protein OXG39_19330 [Chloroflexi bacterium]|nr:hypothetical protein [Chloroflexota bacterium]